MKMVAVFVCIVSITFYAMAAVPNQSATVTAVATGTAGCGQVAEAQVNGSFSNRALQAMGISSISMTGPKAYNSDLTGEIHKGVGSGSATVTQTGVCVVTTDASGNVSTSPSYSVSRSTIPCETGE